MKVWLTFFFKGDIVKMVRALTIRRSEKVQKIDAHNHPDFCNMNLAEVIRNMDEDGIEKICMQSWEAPWDEAWFGYRKTMLSPVSEKYIVPFEWCLRYYEAAPDRFILAYAPDPRISGALQKMEGAIKTYGVKMCGELKLRMMYDNPDCIDLFRLCGEYGVPVTIHMDYPDSTKQSVPFPRPNFWYGGDIDAVERVLKKCPETNFLGHAPGFWAHISKDNLGETVPYPKGKVIPGGKIEEFLGKYPNLYCDCSGGSGVNALSRDREYTKKLFAEFPDRFVYARDEYSTRLEDFIGELDLSAEFLEKFFHGNIERLLGMK